MVAYLSRSDNTRAIAAALSRQYDAELFEIRTARPYPEDYEGTSGWHSVTGARHRNWPSGLATWGALTPSFSGRRSRGGAMPAPLRSFLATHDLSGKTVAPFITHRGNGTGSLPQTLADIAPQLDI